MYKLQDYPWLGVSFNLSSESTAESKQLKQLVSSFSEDVTQSNSASNSYKDKNLVYTTDNKRNNRASQNSPTPSPLSERQIALAG